MKVSVGICTYQRPKVVAAVRSVAAQACPPGVTLDIIVADNESTPAAQAAIAALAAELPAQVRYVHAPERNISIARNAVLTHADGDWLAFLDDDEIAEPDWLARLLAHAGQADVIFGPAIARYPADAPDWIVAGDFHSNRLDKAAARMGQGHSCNVAIRWRGAPWMDVRFDPTLGRSGGEDTAYFQALRDRGARMAYEPAAIVREDAEPHRLSFDWLWRRRFRYGQTHALLLIRAGASRPIEIAKAAAKASACFAAAGAFAGSVGARNRWLLRAALHCGVVARLSGRAALELY